ncbi:hypothetical protein [Mycobacterium sp. Marseille-P9652]|uniref:hypothetical protein n=1 Tax=Mycobacterium sp. Marseille-P9652 TaxID=2654950 RepID=UPI0012E75F3E|nr:hypothetical protein [Mycobacterium sp. Marseille-P9652]
MTASSLRALWDNGGTVRMATHTVERSAARDGAVASPEERLAASSMDGRDENVPNSEAAPPDIPARRKGIVGMLAAVACTVFGAKLITISALGSPVPLVDQWDGEAAGLYAPYLKGTLSLADLFAHLNEHRIFLTRVLALVHLELAGEWNPRLEMILCALVHTALITWLTALLLPLAAPRRRMLLCCFVAVLFAFPIGFENTLLGFNFHFYLPSLFGIAALVAFAAARPFSLRWFGGLTAAVFSYLAFSSGMATLVAAGVLVTLQLATNTRKRCPREFAPVIVLAVIAAAMVWWTSSGAKQLVAITPWTILEGLVQFSGAVVLALVPTVWFCRQTLARRPAISDPAWVAVGIAGWVITLVAMLAYARGPIVAPRYVDFLLLVYPVGFMAVLALMDKTPAMRFGRFVRPGAMAWVLILVAAIAHLSYEGSRGAIDWSKSARHQAVNLQAYLATGNVDHLRSKGEQGLELLLYYPDPPRLTDILKDPDIRAILPPEFRPADADNAGVRNRMWLKGTLATGTAVTVRLLLRSAPAVLALGIGLFFAIAARRSFLADENLRRTLRTSLRFHRPVRDGGSSRPPRSRPALLHTGWLQARRLAQLATLHPLERDG